MAPSLPPADAPTMMAVLAAIIVAAKVLGNVAQRVGQPAVLGELLAGVVLGSLGVFNPQEPALRAIADVGIVILLFQIGLHTEVNSLRKVGGEAAIVAFAGVVVPFAGGFAVARLLGLATIPALVAGAALTATSIGISARVLGDLMRLHTEDGQVVLGAAVLDDIVGLIILSVVFSAVAGGDVTTAGVLRTAGIAIGFVAAALLMGSIAIPPLFRFVDGMRGTGVLGLLALAFALAMAWLAVRAESAMIIGAMAAGLILHPTPQRPEIEASVTSIGHFFVPIFFASVGAAVDLHALLTPGALLLGAALTVVGVAGKVLAGYAPWWYDGNKLLIGVAMVPRGEVGLIFAQMGLASGALGRPEFGAVMIVVVVTTMLSPPWLARIVRARSGTGEIASEPGIDDLVAGTHHRGVRKTTTRRRRPKGT